MSSQLDLDLRRRAHGGARPGAGRPRKTGPRSPHVARAELPRDVPVHVTLRVAYEAGKLRNRVGYRAVRRAIATTLGRTDFRIVHASVQANHVHLLVEADAKLALANGLRAFMISAARHLNRARGRRGAVFTARYHAVQLRTPRQVRNCIGYVLNNWRHHREDLAGPRQRRADLDPYATGLLFDGWAAPPDLSALPAAYEPLPVRRPHSWLLTTGWRRHHPPIGLREVPGA
jgi:REP element-mobilizing transposase RayT